MAAKYRCYRECFAYNKHFKKGDFFPQTWLEAKYVPQPEYFVNASDYEDKVSEQKKESRQIYSAADDPRTSAQLLAELEKVMGSVPKDWSRKKIWMELTRRQLAESKTEPGRKPGRPAMQREA